MKLPSRNIKRNVYRSLWKVHIWSSKPSECQQSKFSAFLFGFVQITMLRISCAPKQRKVYYIEVYKRKQSQETNKQKKAFIYCFVN